MYMGARGVKYGFIHLPSSCFFEYPLPLPHTWKYHTPTLAMLWFAINWSPLLFNMSLFDAPPYYKINIYGRKMHYWYTVQDQRIIASFHAWPHLVSKLKAQTAFVTNGKGRVKVYIESIVSLTYLLPKSRSTANFTPRTVGRSCTGTPTHLL